MEQGMWLGFRVGKKGIHSDKMRLEYLEQRISSGGRGKHILHLRVASLGNRLGRI